MAPTHTSRPAITPTALADGDAARYLGVSRGLLRAARVGRCDGPPYARIGRAVRYRITDLDAWLASRVVGGQR